jgi:hypothetical protein
LEWFRLLNATRTTKPDLIIYSDASGTEGFGFLETNSLRFGSEKWNAEDLKDAHREKESSSTFLEILAIATSIRSLAKEHMAIEVRCDSQPAVYALERRYYRGAEQGQNIIIGLDKLCRDWGLTTFFKHVPREDPTIQLVDKLSKGTIPRSLELTGLKTKIIRVKPYSG